MKIISIIYILFANILNAQDVDTTFNIFSDDFSQIFIESSSAYLNEDVIDCIHKIIYKFEKEVENPFDDEFWPKTPGKLWDSNKRFYFVTLNDKGVYHLFVVSEITYNNYKLNHYFKFLVFMSFGDTFSDLGQYDKEGISQFFK